MVLDEGVSKELFFGQNWGMSEKLKLFVTGLMLILSGRFLPGAGVFLSPGESYTYEFTSMTGLVTYRETNAFECGFSSSICGITFFNSRPGATGEVKLELFETDTNGSPFYIDQKPFAVPGQVFSWDVGTDDEGHPTWVDQRGAIRITLLRGEPTQIVDVVLNAHDRISTGDVYCQHAIYTLVPVRAGPHLDIVQLGRTQAKISWPTNTWGSSRSTADYMLESALNVNAVNWSRVTNMPVLVSNMFSVKVTIDPGNAVFRLIKP